MKTKMRTNKTGLISSYVPDGEVLVLRTSLIKTYLRCPAQCLYRYFKGLVVLPRSFITMGSCTHVAAEHGNKYKVAKKKDVKLSVLQDVFHESFKEKRKTTWWAKDEKPDLFEQEGVKKIVPTFHEEVYKVVKPALVEDPFKLELPEVNAIITGTLDLVEENHMIRDLKIKGRKPNWMEAIKSFQGKSYRSGYKQKYGKKPRGFMLDCIIRTKEPGYFPTKPVPYTDTEDAEFRAICIQVVKAIRAGIFYCNRDNNYFCSPNSCGFWPMCSKGAWKDPGVFTKVYGANQGEEEHVAEGD